MFSTPPAMTTSASPMDNILLPFTAADKPEAQSLLTVSPGTVKGMPASNKAIRATFLLSSPAWFAQPKITSPTEAGSKL